MPFDIGLLSDASLIGVDDATRTELQKQATNRFLLGTILSGRPDIGFTSAINTPNEYIQGQQRIMEFKEKERQQAEENAWLNKYQPNKYQEINPQYMGPVTPDVTYSQNVVKQSQQMGLPTHDVSGALRDLTSLRSPRQSAMLESFKAAMPKQLDNGLVVGPGMNIIGGMPTQKDNITTVPIVKNGQFMGFQSVPNVGASGAIQSLEAAKAIGSAAGQVEKVFDENTKQFKFVPRSEIVKGAGGFGQGALGVGVGVGVGGNIGGFSAEPSMNTTTLNEAASTRFKDFSKSASDAAATVSDRKMAAQQMYDLAKEIKNNKLTGVKAEAYSYLNALPGVGENFEKYASDVTQLNQIINRSQLSRASQLKGSASNLEQNMVARGYATLTDPASATRFLAAQEEALADKDEARQRFVEAYRGDPGKIQTAWQSSPENPKIYNHPKIEQFLRDQVNANPAAPNLPAGFKLQENKGQYAIVKPDGTRIPFQLGR